MRPRPDAAENLHVAENWAQGASASMRPRPDAAENLRMDRLIQQVAVGTLQ